MKFIFNQKLVFAFRLVLGTIFIVSAFFKLYPLEYFELNIAETGIINWVLVPFVSRLMIAFELIIGIFIVFHIYIKITSILSIITLSGFSIYLLYLISMKPGTEDCGCMGLAVSMTPIQSLIKNIILIFFSIIILIYHKNEFLIKGRTFFNKIISISILLFTIALPFIINPPTAYAKKVSDIKTINLKSYNFSKENSNEKIKIQDGKKIVCFFSFNCKFCKLSSRKLHTFIQKNGVSFPLYLVFYGDSSNLKDVIRFQHETELPYVPYIIMKPDSFFQAGGNALPAIFSMNNDSVISKANFLSLNEEDIVGFFK